MGLLKGDLEKVPKGLPLKEYYARIFNWHKRNKNAVFTRLSNRKRDDPYISCYLELIEAMPQPKYVLPEDIAFISREVIAGLMEWAYHEKDEEGVKTAAYAHYVLDTFFDGFHGDKTSRSARLSRLFTKYNMSDCIKRYQTKVTQ